MLAAVASALIGAIVGFALVVLLLGVVLPSVSSLINWIGEQRDGRRQRRYVDSELEKYRQLFIANGYKINE